MSLFKHNGKDITLEDLMKDVYVNSINRKKKIDELFTTVSELITDVGSAVNLMPEVTKLQQVGVNNDDAIVKLSALVVKAQSKTNKHDDDDGFGLSKEELEQLERISRKVKDDDVMPSNSR